MTDHSRAQNHMKTPATSSFASQSEGVSRRRFFAAGATIGAGLAIPGFLGTPIRNAGAAETGHATHDGTPHQGFSDTIGVQRVPFTEGAPLVEPEIRHSVNGELRTSLRLQYAYKDVGGYRLAFVTTRSREHGS
jgi:hypothetical protein